MSEDRKTAKLVLEDGTTLEGELFGHEGPTAGEVVFNTGMVGYPETLTDPSYRGQILVFTYPLVGNYGVPAYGDEQGLPSHFESDRIHARGIVVVEHAKEPSHFSSTRSLEQWLRQEKIPGLSGIDTRALTQKLRTQGTMLGRIVAEQDQIDFFDPGKVNVAAEASVKEPVLYRAGDRLVILVDCGVKSNIIRSLLERGVSVKRVPWNYDFTKEKFDGAVISNGPGDPKSCGVSIENVQKAMALGRPLFGICLGNQIMGLAAGGDTYKLTFGHRSQNQPCLEVGTDRCYITSQNHGYAVDSKSLGPQWRTWFENANDGTNEGIRHVSAPFLAVQFHPEAAPGPVDTAFLFDRFLSMMAEARS